MNSTIIEIKLTSLPKIECESAIEVYSNQPLRWAGFAQVFISFLAILTFFYVYVYKSKQSLKPIHKNLKALYFTTALISAIHAFGVIVTESLFEYTRHLDSSDPCQLQWLAWHCVICRAPILITIPSFTLLHAGITIERFFATVAARTYEQMSIRLSIFILTLITCFVFMSSLNILRNVNWNAHYDYCLLSTIGSGESMSSLYKLMFFLNIPVTVMDLMLLIKNRKQLDSTKNKALSNYKLSEVYQLRENVVVTIHVTLPLIVCRMFTDSIYLLMQGTALRAYFAITPMSTYVYVQWSYCLICLYTLLAIFIPYFCRLPRRQFLSIRPHNNADEETSAHFETLNLRFQTAYDERQQRYLSRKLRF